MRQVRQLRPRSANHEIKSGEKPGNERNTSRLSMSALGRRSRMRERSTRRQRLQDQLRPVSRRNRRREHPAGKVFRVPSFSSEDVLNEADASMLAIAKNGKGKMPAWHDRLSEDQL